MNHDIRTILSKIADDIAKQREAVKDLADLAAGMGEMVLLSDQLDLVAEDADMLIRDMKYLLKHSFTTTETFDV